MASVCEVLGLIPQHKEKGRGEHGRENIARLAPPSTAFPSTRLHIDSAHSPTFSLVNRMKELLYITVLFLLPPSSPLLLTLRSSCSDAPSHRILNSKRNTLYIWATNASLSDFPSPCLTAPRHAQGISHCFLLLWFKNHSPPVWALTLCSTIVGDGDPILNKRGETQHSIFSECGSLLHAGPATLGVICQ